MKATQVLMDEHRVIERVIAALEKAVERLEQGTPVDPGFFIDATEFIREFADGCHHQKEEGVLFKAMTAAGMPTTAGPLAVMLHEHEEGRAFTRGMHDAAKKLQAGDENASALIASNARGYASLLRGHILKEDNVLFPMAEDVIPPPQQAGVEDDFTKLGQAETSEGVREKYVALAAKLEAQVED